MKFPVKISTSDLATVLGVNERTITKLVDKKTLRHEARGCFDLVDATQSYVPTAKQSLLPSMESAHLVRHEHSFIWSARGRRS